MCSCIPEYSYHDPSTEPHAPDCLNFDRTSDRRYACIPLVQPQEVQKFKERAITMVHASVQREPQVLTKESLHRSKRRSGTRSVPEIIAHTHGDTITLGCTCTLMQCTGACTIRIYVRRQCTVHGPRLCCCEAQSILGTIFPRTSTLLDWSAHRSGLWPP